MDEKTEAPPTTPLTPEQLNLMKASLRKKEKLRKQLESRLRRAKLRNGGERVASHTTAGAVLVEQATVEKMLAEPEPETSPRQPKELVEERGAQSRVSIRELRDKHAISQEMLSSACGNVRKRTIGHIETGRTKKPHSQTLQAIIRGFGKLGVHVTAETLKETLEETAPKPPRNRV